MWLAYGDRRSRAPLPSLVRWIEFAERNARDGSHASRRARGEQAPHEHFLWDSGFHWGEWCEPGGNPEGVFTLEIDMAIVATAYLHRSAATLAKVANVLGDDGDVERWSALAAATREAWQAEFLRDDGSVQPESQANLVRALAFDLVPDGLGSRTASRLVELVREAGTTSGPGSGDPFLMPGWRRGYADVAFDSVQDTPPAWLPMIDRGATTIWESWEGIDADDGVGSLNHYSKGAVVTFLHRYIAGIRPDDETPAWRRFRVAPVPGGGITSAEGAFDSPYGHIRRRGRSTATRLPGRPHPPGTEATVELPDGTTRGVGPAGTLPCPMTTP